MYVDVMAATYNNSRQCVMDCGSMWLTASPELALDKGKKLQIHLCHVRGMSRQHLVLAHRINLTLTLATTHHIATQCAQHTNKGLRLCAM